MTARALLALALVVLAPSARADPTVERTTILGPLTGHYAPLHPDNLSPHRIRFYGTDLGWSYEHQGKLHFLFGDTSATENDERIQASTGGKFDDAFGTIDLAEWPDPARMTPENLPRIRLGQNPGTTEAAAIDPGHAMEGFKTPLGGFTNGTREFGLFYTSKPRACSDDADCGADLRCETRLGFAGEPWDTDRGVTFACNDGSPGCAPDPLKASAESGFCVDPSSSFWRDTDAGRVGGVAVKHLVGVRSTSDPRRYENTRAWLTNKFANAAVRTVGAFDPAQPLNESRQDFRPARVGGGKARIFVWGRPGFVGVSATGRPLGLYFAYADLPAGSDLAWSLSYFAGTDASGTPRFSASERDAVAVDLDSTRDGSQPDEVHDIVDQMSISWVQPLRKWVMFYGGGMVALPTRELPQCGVLEYFTRSECSKVRRGNGAIRMRTADHPWGPWSPPQDVLIGGDPARVPPEYQYAPGGVLRHPACTAPGCVSHTQSNEVSPEEYGFLYGANIIEQWTRPAGAGVDIIWNASTWDPYRVILLRTRINR